MKRIAKSRRESGSFRALSGSRCAIPMPEALEKRVLLSGAGGGLSDAVRSFVLPTAEIEVPAVKTQPKHARGGPLDTGAAAGPAGGAKARLGQSLTADRFEPNNIWQEATNLGTIFGLRSEPGLSIHNSTDDDWFRFQLSTTGAVGSRVEIFFNHAAGDLDMALFSNPTGFPINVSQTITDNETISLSGLPAGEYYLRVYGHLGATNGYDLSIRTTAYPADAYEPNNSFAAASDLGTLGSFYYNGLTIHQANDNDYFSFVAEATGTATVTVQFLGSESGWFDLYLYDSGQSELAYQFTNTGSVAVSSSVVAGQTYYVRTTEIFGARVANYSLNIDGPQTLLPAEIHGVVWNDLNGDGVRDLEEPGLAGWTVYLDQNRNGELDDGEQSTETEEGGVYSFTELLPGGYFVTVITPPDWVQTYPGAGENGGALGDPDRRIATRLSGPAWGLQGQSDRARLARELSAQLTYTGSDAPIYAMGMLTGAQEGTITPSTVQSGSLIGMDQFRSDTRFTGIDGSGVSVVVLDTGINPTHTFFGPDNNGDGRADRIVHIGNFTTDPSGVDGQGHGTNVASIVGSESSLHTGMAPGVNLISLKVLRNNGMGSFGWLESALQWVVANAAVYNIVAINMSLGDDGNYNTPLSMYGVGDELAALASLGIINVSAAGNDYHKFQVPGVSYPARDPNSLGVGAVYDANVGAVGYGSGAQAFSTGPDRITPFSQRSLTMSNIFAPGAAITGASHSTSTSTVTMHGTSQAAPHIAGIAALAQQFAMQHLGRLLTPAEFRELMRDTAVTINDGDDENDNVTNTGSDFPRVDVFALAEAIWIMGADLPYTHTITLMPGEVRTGVDFVYQEQSELTIVATDFAWQSVPHRVSVHFSGDASGIITSDSFTVQNLTTSTPVPAENWTFDYDGGSNTATLTFGGYPSGILPNGVYRLTVNGVGLMGVDGSGAVADHSFGFYYLAGDANRDGRVTIADLGILAANWQLATSSGPVAGDFNYDGNVTIADLGILAANWQMDLNLASFGLGEEMKSAVTEAEAAAAVEDTAVNRGQARRTEVSRAWQVSAAHPGQSGAKGGGPFRDGGSLLDEQEEEVLVLRVAETAV